MKTLHSPFMEEVQKVLLANPRLDAFQAAEVVYNNLIKKLTERSTSNNIDPEPAEEQV
jgi:hypothetical protein